MSLFLTNTFYLLFICFSDSLIKWVSVILGDCLFGVLTSLFDNGTYGFML